MLFLRVYGLGFRFVPRYEKLEFAIPGIEARGMQMECFSFARIVLVVTNMLPSLFLFKLIEFKSIWFRKSFTGFIAQMRQSN